MPDTPTASRAPTAVASASASIWLAGQRCARDQRRGRYTPTSTAHPAKMLPAIAAHAIATWTHPGDVVLDPMAGTGTSIVEAMHAGRHGLGIEYEPRWARLAADNIALAAAQGATGTGHIWHGDARHLTHLIPARYRGQVALVLTSPPYGDSTHGQVRTPGPKTGKVNKIDHRYGTDPHNLAYADLDQLTNGFARILAESAALLRPSGTVMVTARPIRRGRELVDIPGLVIAAATHARLQLADRCVALIPAVRDRKLITRASFFQKHNIRRAWQHGDPQWLIGHEDVLAFSAGSDGGS